MTRRRATLSSSGTIPKGRRSVDRGSSDRFQELIVTCDNCDSPTQTKIQ